VHRLAAARGAKDELRLLLVKQRLVADGTVVRGLYLALLHESALRPCVRDTVWVWILQSLLQGGEVPSVCAADALSTEQAGLLRELEVVEDIVEDVFLHLQYTEKHKQNMFANAVPLSEIRTRTRPFSRQSHIVDMFTSGSEYFKIPTLEAVITACTDQK
jgi:hypothetical protein